MPDKKKILLFANGTSGTNSAMIDTAGEVICAASRNISDRDTDIVLYDLAHNMVQRTITAAAGNDIIVIIQVIKYIFTDQSIARDDRIYCYNAVLL